MTRAATKPRPTPKAAAPEAPAKKKETARDLVEQIVVAFIAAFLIRGFEAEAFVIPTGSMAPTLYGQHKEVTCPQCGEVFAVNAAEESDARQPAINLRNPNAPPQFPRVDSATCPNCRVRVTNLSESPTFKGDRILVMKFLYNLPRWLGGSPPSRWDVIVFHFPEEPETNYIKRLIGLPGEIVRVYFGDIFTRPNDGNGDFQIARKPLPQLQAMLQPVWDDTHRPKAFADRPDWKRWKSLQKGGWDETTSGTYRASGGDWVELGYSHLVPSPRQWDAALANQTIPGEPRPILIADYYGYNSGANTNERDDTAAWYNPHWIGDLSIAGRVKAESGKGGVLRIDLVEGGIVHRCTIDLKTGDAVLYRDGKPVAEPASTPLKDDGQSHDFQFANVDDRLTLWVDGRTPFGDGVAIESSADQHPAPTSADLTPAAIAAKGGDVEVSDLVLKRDIYYTQDPRGSDYTALDIPWINHRGDSGRVFNESFALLSDPQRFASLGGLKSHDYEVRKGRYLMMGDNSPRSSDSRAWTAKDSFRHVDEKRGGWIEPWAEQDARSTWEVPESLIIGKAFFIYWPHGVPLWPKVPITRDFLFPFRPYVERMRWIR
jgi:signal peptidase I